MCALRCAPFCFSFPTPCTTTAHPGGPAQTRNHLQVSLMTIHADLDNMVIVIMHDIDKAVLLPDRIVRVTTGRLTAIDEILQVNLAAHANAWNGSARRSLQQLPPASTGLPLRTPAKVAGFGAPKNCMKPQRRSRQGSQNRPSNARGAAGFRAQTNPVAWLAVCDPDRRVENILSQLQHMHHAVAPCCRYG